MLFMFLTHVRSNRCKWRVFRQMTETVQNNYQKLINFQFQIEF